MKNSRRDIFIAFLKIGVQAFGAATGEVIIENLVERERRLEITDIRDGIAIAGLAPGPFHLNLVMNLGFNLGGLSGMLAALTGYILPSFLLACLAAILLSGGIIDHLLTERPGILRGLLAGIAGLLFNAILKLSRGIVVSNAALATVVLLPFLITRYQPPFALVIVGSGLIFVVVHFLRRRPGGVS